MWRSKARSLLLRSLLASRPNPNFNIPSKTLTLIPSLSPIPRFCSSSAPNPSFDSTPPHETPISDDESHEKAAILGESDPDEDIDMEQVESVVSILSTSSGDSVDTRLDQLLLTPSEEFVSRTIIAASESSVNPMPFFKWALRHFEDSAKTSRNVGLVAEKLRGFADLNKMEAYELWDLVKELGKKGFMKTQILNDLIAMFSKLEKSKAALEVFDMFDEFGCSADGDTYFYTVEALGKRSLFGAGCDVCLRMLDSGIFPHDGSKIGKIVGFLCKGKKVKEAYLVYLMAKEKNISELISCLDPLVFGLAKCDETVPLALELLNDYPKKSNKYANKVFGSVVKGLCRIKNVQEAKGLLLRMVSSGPVPGNATFNYVITTLSKEGEMADAVALLKIMESRGLRPDVYSYTVVMSGFAKGGSMDDAHKIYAEARKKHGKLSPATYHVLIRGYCKMEDYEKAMECMKDMKQDGVQPNTDEYDKMINTLCLKALDWRKAEKLLEEVNESGVYVNGTTRSLVAALKELEEEVTQEEGVIPA